MTVTPGTEELHDPATADESDAHYDRNGVRRSKDGRPYVKTPCPDAASLGGPCRDGRVPGKRPGTTKKCPKCKGQGTKEVLYTRCTSFVGACEDRQGLERWMKRTVLVGLAADDARWPRGGEEWPSLLRLVHEANPDDRDRLDALADEAFTLGEGYEKAQKGTDLHLLTERVDRGEELGDVSLADRRDMAAWCRTLEEYGVEVLDVEKFVVHDGLRVGGTYDRRVASRDIRLRCETCDPPIYPDGRSPLTAPTWRPKILDLKTGRVDYGGGKMRQQLAMYANSVGYDPETGAQLEHDVCPHVGFILHIPAGSGEGHLYRCDLVKGWEDVQLSARVREHRRESRNALVEIP